MLIDLLIDLLIAGKILLFVRIFFIIVKTEVKQKRGVMFLDPEQPNIHWDDIVGLSRAKSALRDLACQTGSVLLYGLSGCGMKMLARATATERGASFFPAYPIRIVSPRLGETRQNLKKLFEDTNHYERSLLFFDELDVFFSQGQEQLSISATFLDLMKGSVASAGNRIIMAATGYPDLLEPEILELFQKRIYVGLPDRRSRSQILERRLAGPLKLVGAEIEDLVSRTEGKLLTCADLSRICRRLLERLTKSPADSAFTSENIDRRTIASEDLAAVFTDLITETEREESQIELRERLAVYRDWDPMSFDDFDAEFVPWPHVF